MQRMEALHPLSHQHHDGLLAVLLLKKGMEKQASPDVMRDFILQLWEPGLRRHFLAEELHLQPDQLQAPGTAALFARMKDEHAAIRSLILSLKEGAADLESIRSFADMLEKHIRFEEREFFEALQNEASALQLEELGKQLSNLEAIKSCETYPVRFWE